MAPQPAVLCEIMLNDGRSRSFKVTDFGTDRKPICDFLLVNYQSINQSLYLSDMTLKTQLQPAEFETGQTWHEVHLQLPKQ